MRDGAATGGQARWQATLSGARRLTPQEIQQINTDLEQGQLDTSGMRDRVAQHGDPDVSTPEATPESTFDGRYRDVPDGTTNDQFTLGARGTNVENWQQQMRTLYERTGDEGYNLDPEGRFQNDGVDGMFGEQSERVREHWRSQGSPQVVDVQVEQDEAPSRLNDDEVNRNARDLRHSDRGEGLHSQLINGASDWLGLNWNMGAQEHRMLGIIEGLEPEQRQQVHEALIRDYPDLYPNGMRTLVNNNSQPGPEQDHLLSLIRDLR